MQSDQTSKPDESRRLFLRVFPSIMLPMFIAISDQTLVATALPAIAADLGQVTLITWIVVAFLMMNCLAAPVYGRFGDLIGRRQMMLIALAFVILGAAIVITAPSVHVIILGRAIQGVGGGGLMSLTQALIGQMVPLRKRGSYQGYLAAVNATATVAGPLLGGLLTYRFGWRVALATTIPLALIALVLTLRLPKLPSRGTVANFDAPGLGFFAATVVLLLLAVQELERIARGGSPVSMLLLLGAAGASLILLGRREKRALSPLFPLPVLSHPSIWRGACFAACHGATYVSLVAITPLYLIAARGLDANTVAFLLLTLTMGVGLSSMVTGFLVSRTGRTMIFPSAGSSVLTVLLLVFAWRSPELSTWQLPMFYFAMSLCIGTVMGVLQVTVQYVAGPENLGVAASAVQFSRTLGASLGTSLVGAVIFIALQSGDGRAAEAFAMALRGAMELPADAAAQIRGEMLAAFRPAFLAVAAFAGIGCLMGWSNPVRRIAARPGE
ncbi:MFS transporter [Bosea sp. (in: a-proteobacteria)]|uniref:MFS transporter n=1 Tax=Bosea sp. (in: a-proteobacteria) TaxID=1871050 RepID=UPI002623B754|nr:MFS transporter [Bosea sp. (in: a-proteobacteria)]MCO5093138.1 MFS transporter [Bosea sp. (in: a-proteobacteria)]